MMRPRRRNVPAKTQPWPNPRDTSTDRARAIARSLLAALDASEAEVVRLRAAAGQCAPTPVAATRHRDMAARFGEAWLAPVADRPGREPGARLSTAEAALAVGRATSTIRRWIAEGRLTRHPDGIDERELLTLHAAQRAALTPTEGAA